MNKYISVTCAFHAQEIITHFCKQPQCMLPLCKVCINIHHKEHLNMPDKPNIVEVVPMLDRIRTEISQQKEQIKRKNNLILKQLKLNQDNNRSLVKHLDCQKQEIIFAINERFNQALNDLNKTYEVRQEYYYSAKSRLDNVESTLSAIEDSLFKGKAMRSLIMWESQQMMKMSNDTLRKLEVELLIPDKTQFSRCDKKLDYINKLTKERLYLSDQKYDDSLPLLNYASQLNKIIAKEISQETERKSQNRKSLNRLKNSGISLTQVSGNKLQGRKNMKTPDKIMMSNMATMRNEIDRNTYAMKLADKFKKVSVDSQSEA